MKKIQVYTTQICPYCHSLMDWLDQQGIEYEELDASLMPGIEAVPLTVIGNKKILGFDRQAILQALEEENNL